MRSLVPLAAYDEVSRDVEKARIAGEKNAHPSGFGWTDIYVAQAPSIDYSAIPLRLADAVAIFEKYFSRIPRFTATAMAGFSSDKKDPYGSYETEAFCYGTGAACFVKLEPKEDIVKYIWFETRTDVQEDVAKLRGALADLNRFVPSAIVDYWFSVAGRVGDQIFMDRYFAELLPPPKA